MVPGAPPLVHFDPSQVDPSVDPCTDWYAHVCSRWMAANPIPAAESHWETISNLEIWNETVLRNALEKASQAGAQRSPSEQKIGDYWATCMDEPVIEAAGISPVAAELKRIDALRSKRAIAGEVARLHASVPGVTGGLTTYDNHTPAPLFGFGPIQDYRDSTQVVANLDQGGMGLPSRDFYLSDDAKMKERRQKYVEHVQALFRLAGAPKKRASTDAAAVLRIETALARAAMDVVKRRDPANVNNVRSLAEVRSAAPSFDWKAYLAAIQAPSPKHLIVSSPEFLRGMEQVLKKEPLGAWRAYLRWWTLHGNAKYLSNPFVDADFTFQRTLTGAEELLPAMAALRHLGGSRHRGGGGSGLRGGRVSSGEQGARAEAGQGGGGRPRSVHPAERLDERPDQGAGAGQAPGHRGQDRLPRSLARLLRAHHRSHRPGAERPRLGCVRAPPVSSPRSTSRWTGRSGSPRRRR